MIESEAEKIAKVIIDFLNTVEAACVDAKYRIGQLYGVREETKIK
jgi:hypothetical protein